jgi:hypothetical protein
MIVSKSKKKEKRLEIDLTGEHGNAYVLLGYASSFCKQLKMSEEDSLRIQNKMKSGDYENLLNVFDTHFGHLVIMYR